MNLKFKAVSINFIIIFLLLFIIICPKVNANGDNSAETETTINPVDPYMYQTDEGEIMEITGVSFNQNNDYHLSVENSVGSTVFTSGFLKEAGVKSFTAKNIGTINIENCVDYIDSIVVEDGSAKIKFSKLKTINLGGIGEKIDYLSLPIEPVNIEIDGKTYGISSYAKSLDINAFVEYEDGVFTLSEGSILTVPDGGRIRSIEDGTKIRFEDGIPVLINPKGKVSIDYDTAPFSIILYGTYSSVDIYNKDEKKEKFEVKNIDEETDLVVNIGGYHKDCWGNCVSYVDEGHFDKMKVDGNAKISKYYGSTKMYAMKFEDGKAKLGRHFSRMEPIFEDVEFSKNTVINYNGEDVIFTVYKSKEELEKARQQAELSGDDKPSQLGRITINGKKSDTCVTVMELYDMEMLDFIKEYKFKLKIEEKIRTSTEDIVPISYFLLGDFTEETKELMQNAQNNFVYVDGRKVSIYDLATNVMEDIDEMHIMVAVWQQESTWGTHSDMNKGSCVGLGQVSYGAFLDVTKKYYSEFSEYSKSEYKKFHKGSDSGYEAYIFELLKNDMYFNAKVSARYLTVLETEYGFSELKTKLVGYNAGPTATDDLLEEFVKRGGGSWNDFEEFLSEDYSIDILRYGKSWDKGLEKVEEVKDYIEKIYGYFGLKLDKTLRYK